jgi:hypothetical protein
MKRLLRITVLFSVTLLWWGEKGYAATPAMDAAEKETVSATVEAEADKKDPKSDKKSDEPKRNKVTENRTVIRKSRFIRRSIWNYRTTAGS